MMDDRRYEPTVARDDDEESDSDGEFEFPFVSRDAAAAESGAAPADELFAGGRIRAFYPVFGRVLDEAAAAAPPEPAEPPRAPLGRLFQLEKARTSSVASTSSSSSSSSAPTASTDAAAAGGDLDSASLDSYCLWTPGLSSASAASSPSRPTRKSGSTGSMSRWRRIGDLVVGRSQSDGREKFLFLSAPPSPARDQASSSPNSKPKKKQQQLRGSKATELDTAAAGRRISYAGGGSPGARRTFLPYRQDLVGLFANVQGLRRSHHHPF